MLKLPSDAVDIANGWKGFTLSTEAIQLILIAVLGVVSAWALSRPIAEFAHLAVKWWKTRRAEERERSQEAIAAAERQRREEAVQERKRRDAHDFLQAVISDQDYYEILCLLLAQPSQVALRFGEALRGAGIVELLSNRPTGPAYRDHYAAYRLTELGRSVLDELRVSTNRRIPRCIGAPQSCRAKDAAAIATCKPSTRPHQPLSACQNELGTCKQASADARLPCY